MEAPHATDCASWRDLLDRSAVDTVAAAIDDIAGLEVLDASVVRVVSLCDDPEATAGDLVRVLERDATFAANLLHLANSAAYATPVRARSVRQAVMLIGRRQLRRLALATATVRFLERAGGTNARHGELHARALATASVATAAAEVARLPADGVHLAGLLHDLGRLVLPRAFGASACAALTGVSGADRAAAERAAFGIDHAQAGAILCDRWGLPLDLSAMVAWHHGGPDGRTAPSAEAACVQLADLLCGMLGAEEPAAELLAHALAAAGLDVDDLDAIAAHGLPRAGDTGIARRVAELERQAGTDDLTGLPTRARWCRTTEPALRRGEPGCVLLVDVEDLARVNVRHGRDVGDLVLATLGRIAGGHGDAARFGGDELVVWVPGTPGDGRQAADHLVARAAEAFEAGGGPHVDVAIGIAATHHHGFALPDLLAAAGRGLVDARRAGRSATSLAA